MEKDDEGVQPLFKTSLPSEFVDYKIFEEAKGLGTLIKAEVFENSGRSRTLKNLLKLIKNTITTKEIFNIDLDW